MSSAPPRTGAPRRVITEDALTVHPSLLGLPLASPWRRAGAMAVDGLFVSLLTQATGVLFGFAAAYVLFRASSKKGAPAGVIRSSFRFTARFAGAVALFVATLNGWGSAKERFESGLASFGEGDGEGVTATVSTESGVAVDGLAAASGIMAFSFADDAEEARERGERAVAQLRESGVEDSDIQAMLRDIADDAPEKPWLAAVADSLVAPTASAPVSGADSLALAHAAAVAELRGERDRLREQVQVLERQREEAGVMAMLKRVADDLGLGLGWMGLYFTATLALWRGQTPGKKLLGIRVIRLNGKPIGWWAAFERFGGYWAGVATGLLGFAQILWQPNRQAIQDKITETAVVRES